MDTLLIAITIVIAILILAGLYYYMKRSGKTLAGNFTNREAAVVTTSKGEETIPLG